MVIFSRLVQYENAPVIIVVTPSGIVSSVRPSCFMNAFSAIDRTDSGMVVDLHAISKRLVAFHIMALQPSRLS